MGGWDRYGVVDSYQGVHGGQGVGGRTGGGYYLVAFFYFIFFLVLLSFGCSCPVSFLSE